MHIFLGLMKQNGVTFKNCELLQQPKNINTKPLQPLYLVFSASLSAICSISKENVYPGAVSKAVR